MRWTEELNALLNQCVFECGYDFTAASALLQTRARQLRLVSGNVKNFAPSSDNCQVQWMAINPVVEDDEYGDDDDGGGHGEEDHHLYLGRSYDAVDDTSPSDHVVVTTIDKGDGELRPAVPIIESQAQMAASTVDVPAGCPRLELSLTDDDLDALLRTLPGDGPASSTADSKRNGEPSSEMQWVLSFLNDPDAVAHRDAEAKHMLCNAEDKADDDNYQYFLHELDQANLLSPQKPEDTKPVGHVSPPRPVSDGTSSENDDSSSEDSDDDWRQTRAQLKQPSSATPATHKRRPLPRNPDSDVVLPPAPPLRFPPRAAAAVAGSPEADTSDSEHEDEDLEDNGLDALPRFVPTMRSSLLSTRLPPSPSKPAETMKDAKLLALSREIGQQLRKTGEFAFPKHLFRDREVDIEQEQDPQDEP